MSENVITLAENLIAAIRSGLEGRAGEGVIETLHCFGRQNLSDQTFQRPQPLQQAVCKYLSRTLAVAAKIEPTLAANLEAIAPHLRWLQSASYTDKILGHGFSQNYAWCEIIGPQGFYKGSDFLLGFLMLGPQRHYKDHYHPAPELYWPLTAPSSWKKGDGPFIQRNAGEVIWHPSMVVHATITNDEPLLAVFAWTKDTDVGARLVAES